MRSSTGGAAIYEEQHGRSTEQIYGGCS